jgi:hypothetical protein
MMRVAILGAAILLAVSVFMAWVYYATQLLGDLTNGPDEIAMIVALGVLSASGLAGVIMWLMFSSSKDG